MKAMTNAYSEMRKHADAGPSFSAQNLREFTSTNSAKKTGKSNTRLQASAHLKSTPGVTATMAAKPISWEAYRNELEFE